MRIEHGGLGPPEQSTSMGVRRRLFATAGSLLAALLLAAATVCWVALSDDEYVPGIVIALLVLAWSVLTFAREAPRVWLVALAGLLVMAFVGLYPSIDIDTSLGRLLGIVIGMALVGVTLGWLRTERALSAISLVLPLAAHGMSVVGLVGTDWPHVDKGLPLDTVYDRLPRLLAGLPNSADPGIHPNKLAAPLAMLLPVAVAALVYSRRRSLAVLWGPKGALAAATILLTQSRSAYLAALGSVILVLALRWRPMALLFIPLVAIICLLLVGALVPETATPTWLMPFTGGEDYLSDSLRNRREGWESALILVADFPFTGVGLGMFKSTIDLLYEYRFYGVNLPHAHNLLLQVAIDLGLPGLGFFLLLTGCIVATARRAVVGAPTAAVRGLAAGAAGGLFAYYLYGITDAIGLGERPGLLFWLLIGMVAACARFAPRPAAPILEQAPREEARVLHPGQNGASDRAPAADVHAQETGGTARSAIRGPSAPRSLPYSDGNRS